jgi:hypothetical protein
MAEWFPLPQHLAEPHQGHEAHLCMAENVGFMKNNLEEYKNMCATLNSSARIAAVRQPRLKFFAALNLCNFTTKLTKGTK